MHSRTPDRVRNQTDSRWRVGWNAKVRNDNLGSDKGEESKATQSKSKSRQKRKRDGGGTEDKRDNVSVSPQQSLKNSLTMRRV